MAAADSIRVVDDDYVKRIHSRNPSGHLHKGHGIVAATASIPSKYQTIVTDNADKRGFLSKAKRFKYDAFITEAPGPGGYVGHVKMDNNSTSFSKKGTGSFASKSKKGLKYQLTSAPGPGIYGLPSMLRTQRDYNQATCTSAFHKPIAQTSNKTEVRPGPNQYDILKVKYGKANNVTANAGFKSQTKREVIKLDDQARNPAPGHYDVKDDLLHDSAKVPLSSFKSKTKRQMHAEPAPVPGPGAYRPGEEVDPAKKQLFPKLITDHWYLTVLGGSIICVYQPLRCPCPPPLPYLALGATKWWIMKGPPNTICPVLPLYLRVAGGMEPVIAWNSLGQPTIDLLAMGNSLSSTMQQENGYRAIGYRGNCVWEDGCQYRCAGGWLPSLMAGGGWLPSLMAGRLATISNGREAGNHLKLQGGLVTNSGRTKTFGEMLSATGTEADCNGGRVTNSGGTKTSGEMVSATWTEADCNSIIMNIS
ncbi:O(6)-methylguanine-induced apoptosis 2 [Mizuhopecten yessoensis]|uniref:O(6)-methylguanine-induced apoptosis 2 n=1 Tax=Mizuhopecten yessoensis TaxID=6573 RepID=A0A210QF93_MIZYE|nr:O(6)-methylguanine-induced apoptosis 2 [Mizuhopecten yessoensis]